VYFSFEVLINVFLQFCLGHGKCSFMIQSVSPGITESWLAVIGLTLLLIPTDLNGTSETGEARHNNFK
jgi:hypothetical protein